MWPQNGASFSSGDLFRSQTKPTEVKDVLKDWLTETPRSQKRGLAAEFSSQLKRSHSRQSLAKTAIETLHPSQMSLNRARQSIKNWSLERKSSLTNFPSTAGKVQVSVPSLLDQGFGGIIAACKAKKESLEQETDSTFKKSLSHHLLGKKLVTLSSVPQKICYRSIQASRFKSLGKEVVDKSRHDRMLIGQLSTSATSVLKEMYPSNVPQSASQMSSNLKIRRGNSMLLNEALQEKMNFKLQNMTSAKILKSSTSPFEIFTLQKPLGWHLFDKSRCTTNTRVKDRISSYKGYLETKPALL